ncbi:unnamed protein product [Triticum turgidum subsp. durum]|uniref:Protein kinase domain-containing protein n=1 Tax=Triticum turgidum subsp. durum TaxID=4567 RepID=A0A9R1BN21_TRITD|nr:unnamed protein product [Triticum turgidum subsp. durum]
MADFEAAKPASPVLAAPLDLGATVAERSYLGFAASTGTKYQLNCVLAWNMTVEKLDEPSNNRGLILGLAVGVPVGVLALGAAAALGYYVCVVRRRKLGRDQGSAITGTMIRSLAGGPREFDYRELRRATNNFDERMKLGQPLGWELRYGIVQGVASALHYLHDQFDQRVVHRDLKASNIMLDAAFTARLGDFGLARAIETDKTSYTEEAGGGVHGTVGYIAPECFHTEKATRESDVYAFGAVILEVVCGRRPRCDIDGFHFLVDWVWRLHRDGRALDAVDPGLDGAFDEDDAERLLMLGLACSHPTPAERPKAQAISQILLRSMPTPAVPPFKPSFVWPATDGGFDTMSTTAGSTSSTVVTSTSTWSGNFARGSQNHAPAPEQDTSGSLV